MTAKSLAKVLPISATVNGENHLVIGGCDVVELIHEYGTPLYVFDESTLEAQATNFISAFRQVHSDTTVIYACKAFINVPLARLLAGYGVGFDVVSGGELAVMKAAGIDPAKVHFHGNNKTPEELRDAVSWGVGRVVIDSFYEIELLGDIASTLGIIQPVLIRVSPSIDPHTHRLTSTGVLDSKFGFPIETGQAAEAISITSRTPSLDLRGIHFHLGSPIFEMEPYEEAIHRVIAFAAEMSEQGLKLSEFSPGGGFAIAYTSSDVPPPPSDYAETIVSALKSGCEEHGIPLPNLIVEPGRSITGPAGVALYTVGAIKEIPGVRTFVSVDGGMGDNIRPALYDATYAALAGDAASDEPTSRVTIAGKYCESGDILVKDAMLPKMRPGNIVAIPAAGAYSPSMASTYNLNGRPPIVLVRDGQSRLLRRRETYSDLMAQDTL